MLQQDRQERDQISVLNITTELMLLQLPTGTPRYVYSIDGEFAHNHMSFMVLTPSKFLLCTILLFALCHMQGWSVG